MPRRTSLEGHRFTVPLSADTVLGLVVRHSVRQRTALCRFYLDGQQLSPGPHTPPDYTCRCADASLVDGTWPDLGLLPRWHRSEWPVPKFLGRLGASVGQVSVVDYDDEAADIVHYTVVPGAEAPQGLPQDGKAGTLYVERRLARLLSEAGRPNHVPDAPTADTAASRDNRSEADEDHAVFVHVAVSDDWGSDEDRSEVLEVEQRLRQAVTAAGTGVLDGSEVGQGEAVFFLYGRDKDLVWRAVEPVLRSTSLRPAYVLLRAGGPGAAEDRVNL